MPLFNFSFLFSYFTDFRLPCNDVRGITSGYSGEKSLFKYCEWRGQPIPCVALFSPIPTDMVQSISTLKLRKYYEFA
jgi:hypothetical protein